MNQKIIVAEVLKIDKHPNADKLRLITLNIGTNNIYPVVCGAWNFEEGDKVVLALPGAEIARNIHSENHESFILDKAEIRGVVSEGMICAGFELGIGDDVGNGVLIIKNEVNTGKIFEKEDISENQKEFLLKIFSKEESKLKEKLLKRTDFEAERIKRYLSMPDLSRTSGSPLKAIIDRVRQIQAFKTFDIIDIPEIVPASVCFDMFNFAPEHPARSKSDTYYIDDKNILRTHDTVMWYYYLNDEKIKQKIANKETIGVLCYGKVYRKDEIDRYHMNVFHQMGGLILSPNDVKTYNVDDLKNILTEIVENLFGASAEHRFNQDTFPYTDNSLEIEVKKDDKWVEILGGGMPLPTVLEQFGLTGYNGWAFGFGLERLAILSMALPDIRLLWSDDDRVKKQLNLGQKYVEVSKFPPITRDISFIVDKTFVPNDYFDLIRSIGGELVEEVSLLDKFENEAKFGKDRISYTYRVVYRSGTRTLQHEEVDPLQTELYNQTAKTFNAELR